MSAEVAPEGRKVAPPEGAQRNHAVLSRLHPKGGDGDLTDAIPAATSRPFCDDNVLVLVTLTA
jgi:hypothetical protein